MQSKTQSLLETWAGTTFAFFLSLAVWAFVVNPLYGLNTSPTEGLGITVIFTVVALIRGYYVRRFFNWFHSNNKNKNQESTKCPTSY